jgi:hypothetical protein
MFVLDPVPLSEFRRILEQDVYAECPDVMDAMWRCKEIDWELEHLMLAIDNLGDSPKKGE